MATNTSMPKRTSTPASIAAAIPGGMRSITRSKPRVSPASRISSAQNMKAPTASAIGTPASAVTSIAAPGVDHAVTTGAR